MYSSSPKKEHSFVCETTSLSSAAAWTDRVATERASERVVGGSIDYSALPLPFTSLAAPSAPSLSLEKARLSFCATGALCHQ